MALIDKVQEMGGSVKAIESGWMQLQIADSAWRAQQAIESGERLIVGVNAYQSPGEQRPVGIFRPDPETYRIQTTGLANSRPSGTTLPSRLRWQDCARPPSPRPIPTPT